ncbi:MAG TPA: response regulator [Terriglobales bacterium]|nr:response regulator [Terriglobales bacterium]
MARQFDYRMLIVDDDLVFCEIADELFSSLGYTVRCAEDGFEALAMMKQALPDIIICDLNLPKMSGFELLSIIRRRFPQIPVIAMSGAYAGPELPMGVIADAYLQKGGDHSPEELVLNIRDLLEKAPFRASVVKGPNAPVWIPLDGKQYFVLTCPDCLRSFSLPTPGNLDDKVKRLARCEFCDAEVTYVLDAQAVGQARRDAEI